jgi:hypothetical protein
LYKTARLKEHPDLFTQTFCRIRISFVYPIPVSDILKGDVYEEGDLVEYNQLMDWAVKKF